MATVNDPLAVNPPPAPAAAPPVEVNKKLVCEFCGCQLAPSGEVMKMGTDAKNFRDFPNVKDGLQKQIDDLTRENSELRQKVTALETAPAPTPRTGSSLFSR